MNKYIILGAGAAAVIAAYFYTNRNSSAKNPNTQRFTIGENRVFNETEAREAFAEVAQKYGRPFAQTLNKMFQAETGFKSGQFLKTFSAGMVASSKNFPFGWSSINTFTGGKSEGYYTVNFKKTSAGEKNYIGFPNLKTSILFTAWFIKTIRGGDFGKWSSNDPADQQQYRNFINTMTAKYI